MGMRTVQRDLIVQARDCEDAALEAFHRGRIRIDFLHATMDTLAEIRHAARSMQADEAMRWLLAVRNTAQSVRDCERVTA